MASYVKRINTYPDPARIKGRSRPRPGQTGLYRPSLLVSFSPIRNSIQTAPSQYLENHFVNKSERFCLTFLSRGSDWSRAIELWSLQTRATTWPLLRPTSRIMISNIAQNISEEADSAVGRPQNLPCRRLFHHENVGGCWEWYPPLHGQSC